MTERASVAFCTFTSGGWNPVVGEASGRPHAENFQTGCESHGESSLPLFGGTAGVEGTVINPRLAVQPGPEFSLQGAVRRPCL